MGVVGRAAHEILAHVEGQIALGPVPVDDLANLLHHLGADAVAGKNEKGRIGHIFRGS